MDLASNLEILGLSPRESKVYLALLSIGSTTITRIISSTGIPSSKIYDILERLEQKGLAKHIIISGKRQFQAENPNKIRLLVEEKNSIVEKTLPALIQMFTDKSDEVIAEIYKGKEAMKNIFDDILNKNKTWDVMGGSGKGMETIPAYLSDYYERLCDKNIKTRILFANTQAKHNQADNLKKYQNIKIKFLPKKIRNLMVIFIYDNNIFLIPVTDTTNINPVGILIRNKETSEGYRDYFNWLWSIC